MNSKIDSIDCVKFKSRRRRLMSKVKKNHQKIQHRFRYQTNNHSFMQNQTARESNEIK